MTYILSKRVYHPNWELMVLRKSLENLWESFGDGYRDPLVDFKVGIIDSDLVITLDLRSSAVWSIKKKEDLINGCVDLVPTIFEDQYDTIRLDIYMDQQYIECVEFEWIPDCKTKEEVSNGNQSED